MSREIRFRGKRFDNGEWVYGDLAKYLDGSPFIMPKPYFATRDLCDEDERGLAILSDEMALGGFISVIPETVGQLTGLKDKNGVDIYEGDILKDIVVGMVSQVVFTDYANFGLKSEKIKNLGYEIIDPSWTSTSVYIIGNIHENPELL